MEDALQLEVPTTWLTTLRDRLLVNYNGSTDPVPNEDKPVITYLSRQSARHRRILDSDHLALIRELKKLENEGLAEVNVEAFEDGTPVEEQVAKIARTTVSVDIQMSKHTFSVVVTGRVVRSY